MSIRLYFYIFNNVEDLYIRINLMGMIAFYISAKKHIMRKSPFYLVARQAKGLLQCFYQAVAYFLYTTSTSRNRSSSKG